MRGLSGLIFGAVLAGPLAAQEQCQHADLIVEMADYVIEARTQIDGPQARGFGARLAYLKMHYGGLAGEEIEALWDVLELEDSIDFDLTELRDTYALSQDGGLATWQGQTDEVVERFRTIAPSTLRALILADEGETYLSLWALTRPEEDDRLRFSYRHSAQPALLLSDQPEDVRQRIADRAEAARALDFAAALLAGQSNLTQFDAMLLRHPDHFELETLPRQWAFARYGEAVRERLFQDVEIEERFGGFLRREYEIDRLDKATYPRSFLFIYRNQGGAREETYAAVETVLADIDAGTLDPLSDPEAVWVAAFRGLLAQGEGEDVRALLASFSSPSERYWYDDSSAVAHLDVFVAKDLFGPYVRGETDDLPSAPDVTSVDWAVWTQAANLVRHGGPDPVDGRTAMIELLWEAERFNDAWLVGKQPLADRDMLHLARDLAGRLDMQCDRRSILEPLREGAGRSFFFNFP